MDHVQQSPTDPDFVQNPYPFYDRARRTGDFVFWDDYDMPAAMSHRAVRACLTDRRFGRQPPAGHEPEPQAHLSAWQALEANSMLELEPPRHTRLRKLVLKAFTSQAVAGLAPRITQICNELIDRFPDTPFDMLDHFARPLPVTVIAEWLGVPTTRCDDLLKWSNTMVAMYQSGRSRAVEDAAEQASKDFVAYLEDLLQERRRAPGSDLISHLIAAEDAGDQLTPAELRATIILLLNAGHEATVHTLGNGTKALIEHRVKALPDTTVEEILRYDPPLHIFTRWVYEDVTMFGTPLAANTQVACVLAAANRDPELTASPNTFDPTRPASKHMAFGAGLHFCVGAPLARLELDIAWKTLWARCPNLILAGPVNYANSYHFHGLETLYVRKST